MAEFKISLQKTLAHEGGYVNDPVDAGGETYKGISRNSHDSWSGWLLIDLSKKEKSFPVNIVNNVALQQSVEQFYLANFWLPLKAELIANQTTADSIFDFAVNAGVKTSVQLLQSIVGAKIDGIMGNQTLQKLNSLDFCYFQPAFTVRKISYYIAIIKNRPTNKKYLYGWIIRSLSLYD